MKEKLIQLLNESLSTLQARGTLSSDLVPAITINACKDKSHGDYATNCALSLAKAAKVAPRELAQKIVDALPKSDFVQKIEIAGPGFINFFLNEDSFYQVIPTVLEQGEKYGQSDLGYGKKIHIEYVSANPTGPLHVGHGRGAAYGACVSNLLKAVGYDVHREYYVNDVGRQMQILTLSVWLRYLHIHNEEVDLPAKCYQGDYIIDIANTLTKKFESRFHHTAESIQALLTNAITEEEDGEKHLDLMIAIAKQILGAEDFAIISELVLTSILDDIRDDLEEFGVTYDQWFYESQLFKDGLFKESLKLLETQGFTYEKDGAIWFTATKFGDEKDRVLVRSNGMTTYFASDVAYHLYKYHQGYDKIIDVFGADHHGYIARIRAFLKALKEDPDKVQILMVQFAILYRGKEKVSMSTRAGKFVTLRELRSEVGNDAARFFYIMRKPEQHLDFDLELAKSHSNENPVYYIQYAHARICSIWRQLELTKTAWDKDLGFNYLSLLTTQNEKDLMNALVRFPDLIKTAANNHEPHSLAYFLLSLANSFHSYYNAEKFLVEQAALRNARLCLVAAVQQVFVNGLTLLGISAPKEM